MSVLSHPRRHRCTCFLLLLVAAWISLAPPAAAAEVQIKVVGVRGEAERNVRAYIGEPVSSTAAGVRAWMRVVRREALRAMEALGYYRARVVVHEERQSRGKVLVRIEVEPGEPVRISRLHFAMRGSARTDGTEKLLRRRLELKVGQVFHHGDYEAAKRRVRETLNRKGFFEHQFVTHRVTVRREANAAEIEIEVDSGPRYYFGEVRFEGAELDPELLAGMVPFATGDPYDADQVARLNRILQDSQYFSRISLDTERSAPEFRRVDIGVSVSQRARNVLGVGAGYATDTGPRVRFSWEKPWLNPEGHAFRSEMDLSVVRQKLVTGYSIPLRPPLSRSLEFNLNWQHEDIEDTVSEQLRAAVQLHEPAGHGWDRTLFLRHDVERFSTGDDRGETVLIMPGFNFTRVRRRGGVLASWGDRQFVEVQGGSEAAGSDLDIVQVRLGTKWLRTLYAGSRLQARLDLGTLATNRFEDAPPSLRFYAGGDQSIRGFAYRSLGPEDATGEVVGGRHLAVGSLELDWLLRPEWRMALFVDGGGAFDSPRDPLQVGTGTGLRWISPVGPIRVDFAVGLGTSDTEFRLHFSMGPDL